MTNEYEDQPRDEPAPNRRGPWTITLEPEGRNDGYERNEGGLIVRVTNGSHSQEVSRVGFIRRNSKNPHASYEHQVRLEIAKARTSCELLNAALAGAGDLA